MKTLTDSQAKAKPELYWFFADRWFRVVEFSLILATLYYFKERVDFILLKILYWVSLFLFYMWMMEVIEYIMEKIFIKFTPFKRLLFSVIPIVVILLIYAVVTLSTQEIIEQQFG